MSELTQLERSSLPGLQPLSTKMLRLNAQAKADRILSLQSESSLRMTFSKKKRKPHLSGKEKITDLGGASRGDMCIVQNQFIMNFCLSGLSSTDSHPPKPPFHRPHHDVGLPRAIRSNDAGELVKRTCENGTGELPRFRRCRFHPY